MTERVREIAAMLREWRAGVHHITDDSGHETGELVDERKSFETMQIEREDAATIIETLAEKLSEQDKELRRFATAKSAAMNELGRIQNVTERLDAIFKDWPTPEAFLAEIRRLRRVEKLARCLLGEADALLDVRNPINFQPLGQIADKLRGVLMKEAE